jgi:rare lipoprotein A
MSLVQHASFVITLALFLALAAGPLAAPAAQLVDPRPPEVREGVATFYGKAFHGKRTASGTRFDMNELVAAHRTLPFGTIVRVTHVNNGRSVDVRIVDRLGKRRGKAIIDLSRAAAQVLGFIEKGRAQVRLRVLRWGK